MGLRVAKAPEPPSNDTTSNTNDDVNNDNTKTPEAEQLPLTMDEPDAQVGLALASNNYVLLAKEVWELINQDHLHDDNNVREANDADHEEGYGLMAVIDDNGDLRPNNGNQLPHVEHSKEFLLHVPNIIQLKH